MVRENVVGNRNCKYGHYRFSMWWMQRSMLFRSRSLNHHGHRTAVGAVFRSNWRPSNVTEPIKSSRKSDPTRCALFLGQANSNRALLAMYEIGNRVLNGLRLAWTHCPLRVGSSSIPSSFPTPWFPRLEPRKFGPARVKPMELDWLGECGVMLCWQKECRWISRG